MDNLVKCVIGEYSNQPGIWKSIPYPEGFNTNNSAVFIQSLGDVNNNNITFKINYNKLTYSAIGLNGYTDYMPLFMFIKTINTI